MDWEEIEFDKEEDLGCATLGRVDKGINSKYEVKKLGEQGLEIELEENNEMNGKSSGLNKTCQET